MFEKMTADMLEAAQRVVPLVKRFATDIAEDSQRMLSMDASISSPLTEQSQIVAVRRIRSQVQQFDKELAEIHQQILVAAQAIALTWVVPGDIESELKRVGETAMKDRGGKS